MAPEVNQGYEIIKCMRVGNIEFVLGHNPKAPESYVTWKRDFGTKNYYYGNYFVDEKRALRNLKQRVHREKSYER